MTQKVFVLNFITKYLPIFLTGFVYIPFGNALISRLQRYLLYLFNDDWDDILTSEFHVDASRLRKEVIALTVTDQLASLAEELVLPAIKLWAKRWYNVYLKGRTRYNYGDYSRPAGAYEASAEIEILSQVREEADREPYNVQEDIQQMVIQFGYLALFSPVWPLVPIGFLIDNWIELRSDLLKISIDHQRPHPVRTDGIGSWIDSLSFLTWLGSIVTAAIVHLFWNDEISRISDPWTWYTLPVTIFASEHIYLSTRYLARVLLEQIGSEEMRRKQLHQYALRKQALKQYMNLGDGENSRDLICEQGTVEGIRTQLQQQAEKSPKRLAEIRSMIEYLKAEKSQKLAEKIA